MKKRGFSLAEVMITLGIVAVISAMLLPSFVGNVQKQVWSKTLAATISDLETGFSRLIVKENVLNLTQTRAWNAVSSGGVPCLVSEAGDDVMKAFASNTGFMTSIGGGISDFYEGRQIFELDRSVVQNLDSRLTPYRLKNGAVVFLVIDVPIETQNNGKFEIWVADVLIDINGVQTPNTLGRDIFLFSLDANDKLYPWGGLDDSVFWNGDDSAYWRNNDFTGQVAAARLIENNYRMDY